MNGRNSKFWHTTGLCRNDNVIYGKYKLHSAESPPDNNTSVQWVKAAFVTNTKLSLRKVSQILIQCHVYLNGGRKMFHEVDQKN